MIKNIHIQNYKLFKSFQLKEMPKILLIGGKNSCGKSSFLEALYLALSFDCANILISRHLLLTLQGAFWFRSFFSNMNIKEPIIIEYKEGSHFRKVKFEGKYSASVPLHTHPQSAVSGGTMTTPVQNGLNITYWENIHKAYKETLLYTMNNHFYYKDPNFLPPPRNACFLYPNGLLTSIPVYIDLYSHLILKDPTNGQKFLEALQILHPDLKLLSVLFLNSQPMIYGDIGGQKVPLSIMGGGINGLMSLLLAISSVENGVVFIDEMENGFHHSVLPQVWKVVTEHAKKSNTQIIATTHSRELIASVTKGLPENLRADFQYRRIEREKENFKTVDYNFDSLETALSLQLETR